MKQLMWGAALLAVGIAAGFGVATLRAAPKLPASASASVAVASVSAGPVVAPSASAGEFRARLQAAMQQAQSVSVEDGEAFLNGLEAQARRRGLVTALDVEPGIVYLQIHGTPERAKAFTERMLKLQSELGGPAPPAPSDAVAAESSARALLSQIEQSRGEKQQALIRELLEKMQQLPDAVQRELADELNRIVRQR